MPRPQLSQKADAALKRRVEGARHTRAKQAETIVSQMMGFTEPRDAFSLVELTCSMLPPDVTEQDAAVAAVLAGGAAPPEAQQPAIASSSANLALYDALMQAQPPRRVLLTLDLLRQT